MPEISMGSLSREEPGKKERRVSLTKTHKLIKNIWATSNNKMLRVVRIYIPVEKF